jgi:hypothetical protein
MAVDYEAIAGRAVRAMNPQDLQRLLVVCALVSDLYCPGLTARHQRALHQGVRPGSLGGDEDFGDDFGRFPQMFSNCSAGELK